MNKTEQLTNCATSSLSGLTLKESLTRQLECAKAEVARLEEVIQILNNNLEVQRILELLGRNNY